MKTSMCIDLSFNKKKLFATATISLKSVAVNNFSFALNCGFTINEILCNGQTAQWEKTGESKIASFISLVQEIAVSGTERIDEIIIKYSGCVPEATMDDMKNGNLQFASYYNIITDEIRALSYYSAWYPMRKSVNIIENEVVLWDCSDYFVVQGVYNSANKTWMYGGDGRPMYNILAYKNDMLKTVTNPYLHVYYISCNDEERAEKIAYYYRDVLDFYDGTLYTKKDIPECHMACIAPVITIGGAYQEDPNLIVTTSFGENDWETAAINAHETAHYWCSGAPSTWEDWLNETTAEWSALLYAQEREDTGLFNYIITRENRLEAYKTFPPIRTKSGERPDGVHHRGVVLFYEIYKRYGKEAIKTILQIFAGLENKTTDELLKYLRERTGDAIPSMIEQGLLLEDYSTLA